MNSGDGGHSLRRLPIRSPKKSKKGDDRGTKSPSSLSVHTKNFYIASYPVVLLFNVLRTVLYHIYLLLKTLFRAGNSYLTHTRGQETTLTELDSVGVGGERVVVDEVVEEGEMPPKTSNPGPGDPLLARQKHHHRKAFEYISKALKIDEENEGESAVCLFSLISSDFSLNSIMAWSFLAQNSYGEFVYPLAGK